MSKLESKFEQEFCKRLKDYDKDIIVLKLTGVPGIPDRIVLHHNKFALLEFKRSKNASHRPLQDWYINHFAQWTESYFVYPENADDVYNSIIEYFDFY